MPNRALSPVIDPMADDFELDNTQHIMLPEKLAQKGILEWWKDRQLQYPYLSQVARCLRASEVASGAVELDIGNFYKGAFRQF